MHKRSPDRAVPPEAPQPSSPSRWGYQFYVALAILAAFALLVIFMFANSIGDEIVWQRRVYLFGAVEAIVFTAVGWLFGREVHRAEVESARADKVDAKREIDSVRAEASETSKAATEAEKTAAEERTRGEILRSIVENIDTGSRENSPADVGFEQERKSWARLDLRAVLDELYRDQRHTRASNK